MTDYSIKNDDIVDYWAFLKTVCNDRFLDL